MVAAAAVHPPQLLPRARVGLHQAVVSQGAVGAAVVQLRVLSAAVVVLAVDGVESHDVLNVKNLNSSKHQVLVGYRSHTEAGKKSAFVQGHP